ncbi:MAG: hypothetical protein EA373_11040 [Oceanospirillales bacterium]|nr:MAG: hypothetical protein EA373_11040 [Oceanospirillales bacterium]
MSFLNRMTLWIKFKLKPNHDQRVVESVDVTLFNLHKSDVMTTMNHQWLLGVLVSLSIVSICAIVTF